MRLNLALGAAKMGVWEWDVRTNAVYWSPECYALLGLKSSVETLESFTKLVHPEDRERVMKAANEGLADKKVYSSEFRINHPNGEVRWISNFGQGKYDKNGDPLTLIGTVHDITDRKQAEQELQFRNILLSTQQETSIDGILVVDETSRILSYNRCFVEMWRIPAKLIEDRNDEPVLESVMAQMADPQAFHERIVYLYSQIHETSQDELILVDGRIIERYSGPMFGPDERYYGRVWYFRDITERKRAEEALSQSEQRLALHIEKTPLGVIQFDPSFRIVSWNSAAEKIFGYTQEEAIGKHASILVPESSQLQVLSVMKDLEEHKGGERSTNENIRRDGRKIYCEWYNTPLITQDGSLIGVASLIQDISESLRDKMELIQYRDHLEKLVKERTLRLTKSEASLRKYSEEIADLYNNAPCGYHSLGPDGTILRINDTELRWLGYSQDEIVGKKNLVDLLTPEYKDRFRREFPILDQAGDFHDVESCMVRKDGTLLPVLINATVLKDVDGSFIMSRETLIDNTERLRAAKALHEGKEAAESASRAKSAFLANMSHEIRTPMNAILGFTQLMLRDPDFSTSQRQHLETINRSGEHLLDLINDILEMSKIEAGRISLNPTTFDLSGQVHDLETMFRIRTISKSLNFQVIVQEQLSRYVVADENKLRQIFINLLGNAVKFTDRGGIIWRIHTAASQNGRLLLISEVEDTGPGIAPEEMDKLFQVFGQTATGITKGGGTGLGLAISSKFTQMMGGSLVASSQPGKGSLFRLEVEILEGQKNEVPPKYPARRVARLSANQQNYRVLVVDDQPENRQLVFELLREVGFTVKEAKNGSEAVQTFQKWAPHLIVMDIHMPVMDGYEAIRQIKAMEKGKSLPIIAISANAFIEDEKKALDTGANVYVRKPIKDFELFNAIETCLGVHYEDEDENKQAHSLEIEKDASISAKILAGLPEVLIDSIRQATLTANLGHLLDLINQVGQQSPQAADQLRLLANNYQYDRLLALFPEKKGYQ
jgi:two-component system, sensor histidine kinase and response regulator